MFFLIDVMQTIKQIGIIEGQSSSTKIKLIFVKNYAIFQPSLILLYVHILSVPPNSQKARISVMASSALLRKTLRMLNGP